VTTSATLGARAFNRLFQFFTVMLVILFAAAQTLAWWQAWLFLLVFATSLTAITGYFLKVDPPLIERRLRTGPSAEGQRIHMAIQILGGLLFGMLLMVPGIEHRSGGAHLPGSAIVAGNILVIAGLFVIYLVFRENSFTSASIEIARGQHVVTTGPYRYVRHPMYAGGLLMKLGIPIALDSVWGLLLWLPMAAIIVVRLTSEEAFLTAGLPGYSDYRARTAWRLVPGIY
jgi:protein-S-isoprenylcysteine O-methyltransferase Ste14